MVVVLRCYVPRDQGDGVKVQRVVRYVTIGLEGRQRKHERNTRTLAE